LAVAVLAALIGGAFVVWAENRALAGQVEIQTRDISIQRLEEQRRFRADVYGRVGNAFDVLFEARMELDRCIFSSGDRAWRRCWSLREELAARDLDARVALDVLEVHATSREAVFAAIQMIIPTSIPSDDYEHSSGMVNKAMENRRYFEYLTCRDTAAVPSECRGWGWGPPY
jgi:hypothetical protein